VSSLFRLRPRYRLRSPLRPGELRARLAAALASPDASCRGQVDDDKIELVPRGDHHFWTPELRARVDDADDGDGSVLAGKFGPTPAVWTLFTIIYIHLAFIAVAGSVYAMAQLTLGHPPSAAWAVPICLALALLLRLGVQIGQSLGADQIETIRAFVAGAVGGADDAPG
jgi:hypothetical protein